MDHREMKKFLLIVLGVMLALSAFADEADKNGLISGWKFVPVQVGVGDFYSNIPQHYIKSLIK